MYKLNFGFLNRKKKFNEDNLSSTNFSRVLGLVDITAIGISCTLGSGIYVLSGSVIGLYSGPSIILSFLIAAVATFFSGICYAELGARVPRSGSAYTYIYVTIGEFFAFIMGWDLILEYILGTSSISSALSKYIDDLSGKRIEHYLKAVVPINVSFLGPYPDFLAFGLALAVTAMMIIGVKESAGLNKIFTLLNVSILTFIIIAGSTKGNFSNWSLKVDNNTRWVDDENRNKSCSSDNPSRCGTGGFMPFEFGGVIKGAAKCFYAFIGFDAIASTGEEVINPKKNIPLSIIITLVVITLLYCGLSSVLTLMIPYYVINTDTPLPHAFKYAHIDWAVYVVSVGAIVSLSTCLYAGMFPMPRIVYSMSSDGLIFSVFSKVSSRFKTPFIASIVTGIFAGILGLIFDLNELVDMLSIGTLMAYSLVSICVLILRYRPAEEEKKPLYPQIMNQSTHTPSFLSKIVCILSGSEDESIFRKLFAPINKEANYKSYNLVCYITVIAVGDIIAICAIVSNVDMVKVQNIIIVTVLTVIAVLLSIIIRCQPQLTNIITFKIPFVPFLPLIAVFINVLLMMTLTLVTWARFLGWFAIGLIVYFGYGIRNSKETSLNKKIKNSRLFNCVQVLIPCLEKRNDNKVENAVDEKTATELTKF